MAPNITISALTDNWLLARQIQAKTCSPAAFRGFPAIH